MLLPIVDRELRVSARNKATHRLRLLFAIGAVTVGGAIGLFAKIAGGSTGSELGVLIFGVLKWIAFIFACAAGVFLTSDCLSEEKREGTLGLLFLTDLRGHDVVLGKLLATSLRSFYSLLAIFPVMALAFVLGGVTAGDFWHTLLALCNTLFFSLALGMLISVVSRHPHKAMTAALTAIVIFLFLPTEVDWLILGRNTVAPLAGLFSPLYAFTHADVFPASDFWRSLAAVNLTGWIFLAIASWLAPKTWHEKGFRAGPGWRFGLGRPGASGAAGRKLRDLNPVCWIIARDRWGAYVARLVILLVLAAFALSLLSLFHGQSPAAALPVTSPTFTSSTTTISSNGSVTSVTTFNSNVSAASLTVSRNWWFLIASWCASVLSLALEFWLVSQVCRFYVEGKKSGFLELLLVTPIKPADIFRGHWLALRRLFLPPVAAQLFLTLACGVIQAWATYATVMATTPKGAASPFGAGRSMEIEQFLAVGLGAVSWCVGLVSLVWFSIWMGMTSTKITLAMLKTFWYVKILPWFGVSFASGLLGVLVFASGGFSAVWLFPLVLQGLFIGVNFGLIAFARGRARAAFAGWSNLTAT